MKRFKTLLCLFLSLALILTLAGCGQQSEEEPEVPTLNIGLAGGNYMGSGFQERFSPFYASGVADHQVMELTQLQLLPSDRAGVPVCQGIEGEVRPYNGTDYTYYGPANLSITENADGTVFYDITLREDLTFSDGEPVTVDDLIFSLYVLCDPAYNGPSRLGQMPLQGLEEYQANRVALSALLFQLGEDNTDFTLVTQEEQTAFWAAVDGGLADFAQEILDLEQENYGNPQSPADYAEQNGVGTLPQDATTRDLGILLAEQYDWDFARMDDWRASSYQRGGTPLPDLLGEVYLYSNRFVSTGGQEASRISGLQRTGDYSLRVVADRVEVELLYTLAEVYIAPLHYYGDSGLYDQEHDSFGFPKGDLSGIQAKNAQPLGAGPYQLTSYENGVVTCRANEQYYLGTPQIPQLRLSASEYISMNDALATGDMDLCMMPSGISFYEIDGVETWTLAARNNSYYQSIGLDPQVIQVAGDPWSQVSRNLRKGFATVIAACRRPSLEQVAAEGVVDTVVCLDYPISNTTWLVPGSEDPAYEEAYARNLQGDPIYSADMTEEQRLKAAQQAALEFFAAAGCTVENGKVTAPPTGTDLDYEVRVLAPEKNEQLLTMEATAEALAELGVNLTVVNIYEEMGSETEDSNQLFEDQEIWVGGWDASDLAGRFRSDLEWHEWYLIADPDAWLSPIYYADTANGGADAGQVQTEYGIVDPELDRLLVEGRSTLDFATRQTCYRQCLERIWDLACEVPLCQYQDKLIFRPEALNADTLPGDMTAYYCWSREIHTLAMTEAEQ